MIKRYKRREEKYKLLSNKASKIISRIIFLKFVLIIVAVIQTIVFYKLGHYLIGGAALFALLLGYLYCDKKHYSLIGSKDNADILASINSDAVKRFNGQWRDFKDTGDDFNLPDHPYSSDLDIIGKDSLYQWINMCATPWGRKALANELLSPSDNIVEISSRQDAINELSPKVNFRHRLRAEGIKLNANAEEFRELVKWAQITQPLFRKRLVIAIIRSLPFVTLISFILGIILKIIPSFIPVLMLIFHGFLLLIYRKNLKTLGAVFKCNHSLTKLEGAFTLLEKHKFKTRLLKSLQGKMLNEQNNLPSKQIHILSNLASNISNRNHMFYFLINLFLLWDYQCYISLEKWKYESGKHLKKWFEVLGGFEALSSISLIRYDHPAWVAPSFEKTSSSIIINAMQVGHPLITHDCVRNDIQLTKTHPIILITGSNMSGKSTFLRTVGVNLVLAYIGAPVFAKSFSCQCMSLYTCMRVADNLQKNISSFYAEIIRVKMIIDQVKNHKVFFLIDELFKGTNSADRHTAAKTIIQNLNQNGASGMVSTHDLELEVLEKESSGKVRNYHFKESYHGNQISFDYKLRRGVSDTRNAIFLIKASGIDVFDK